MEKKQILDNFGRQTYFGHRAGAQGILYIFFSILAGPSILAMFSRATRTGPPDRRTGPDPDRTRTGVTSAEQRLLIMDHGSRIMDHGSTIKYQGSWIMDQGSWIKDHGSRIMDQVSSIKYPVSRIKDLGPCSGMNDHPGRDTDVRSRPSESTIKDLSFYIGFIKIQSSNKHVGPCFGTKGQASQEPGQWPAKGQAKGQPRVRPRTSQGQAKGQPRPGQGPARGQTKGHPCIMDLVWPRMSIPEEIQT